MADKKKVAFLGLGVMGFPMAGHLASNGYDIVVYNRTITKSEAWSPNTVDHLRGLPERPLRAAMWCLPVWEMMMTSVLW